MFNFRIDGLDRLTVDFLTLEQLDDDQIWGVIEPAAVTLQSKMREVISRLFRQRTGSLRDSIEITRRKESEKYGGYVYALVGPNDAKHPKATQGKRKPRTQGGGGGHYAGTNDEVGWILEYGSSRIPAYHWMETAGDECMDEMYAQMEAAWSETLSAAGF